jgi:energy-coupling factor transporter ATP-binding protein EcfA2
MLEILTLKLGGAVAKALIKSWVDDSDLLADTSADIAELLTASGLNFRERRRVSRELEEATERVAERLQPFFEAEQLGGIPEGERYAAARAVANTIEAGFTEPRVVLAANMDAQRLETVLREASPSAAADELLQPAAVRLYDIALQESCAYLITMVENLPRFHGEAFAELLARDHAIIEKLDEALDHLPTRSAEQAQALDFETRYRREIARRFDQLELFGLSGETDISRYRLSVAYLTLTAATRRPRTSATGAEESEKELDPEIVALQHEREEEEEEAGYEEAVVKVDTVVASSPRLLVRGDAGSGKTTLLQWLAVNAARETFPDRLSGLNELMPFVLQLRRFADAALPSPARFIEAATPMLAEFTPEGWVARKLDAGAALILIDGVDELRSDRRDEVRGWLEDLLNAFPACRVVVTSRPPAVGDDWLETAEFEHCALEPMGLSDLDEFIAHWHDAVAVDASEEERETLRERRLQIQRVVRRNAPLRRLATNPLLCAMLCAINRKDSAQLPDDRVELYRIALDALLQKRDAARKVDRSDLPRLGLQKKLTLLQDLAYWLVRNGYTDAPRELAVDQLERTLERVAPELEPHTVFDSLLQRTGLLREPVQDRVDFIHRTFLEYLAALAVVDHGDIGLLVEHANDDAWSEIIVLAAGSAIQSQRHELVKELLDRGERASSSPRFDFLAVACLESARELDPELAERVQDRLAARLPAESLHEASELAAAGALAVRLLGPTRKMRAVQAQTAIRALGLIGTEEAMEQLAHYGSDVRVTVTRELIRQWPRFDVFEYASTVMVNCILDYGHLEVGEILPLAVAPLLRRLTSLTVSGPPLDPPELAIVDALGLQSLTLLAESGIEDLSSLQSSVELQSLNLLDQLWLQSLAGIERLSELTDLRVAGSEGLEWLIGEDERWPIGLSVLAITGAGGLEIDSLRRADLRSLTIGARDIDSLDAVADLTRLSHLRLIGIRCDLDLFPLIDLNELRTLEIVNCTGEILLPPRRSGERLNQLSIVRSPSLYSDAALGQFGGAERLKLSGTGGVSFAQIARLEPQNLVIEDPTIRRLDDFPASVRSAKISTTTLEDVRGLAKGQHRVIELYADVQDSVGLRKATDKIVVLATHRPRPADSSLITETGEVREIRLF